MFLFKKPRGKSKQIQNMGKTKKNKVSTSLSKGKVHPSGLLCILDQVYNNDKVWLFREDLKAPLFTAMTYLEKHEQDMIGQIDYIFGTGSQLSELQFESSKNMIDSLSKEDFRTAYQQLCHCIDNYGWSKRSSATLSSNEFILYYTLIKYFISTIEKWEKDNSIRINQKGPTQSVK